jgi:hypothetical protein
VLLAEQPVAPEPSLLAALPEEPTKSIGHLNDAPSHVLGYPLRPAGPLSVSSHHYSSIRRDIDGSHAFISLVLLQRAQHLPLQQLVAAVG